MFSCSMKDKVEENAYTNLPRLKVWKLRKPNVKQEFARLATDRKDEVFKADNVESKWNSMKGVWQKETEQVCGWTKGPPSGPVVYIVSK